MEKKKDFKILGISIWRLFAYFIIYSFIGYIIETIFGIITTGLWQSRQSFLYGPFLGIYGVGAVIIIVFSKYFNKNKFTLFLGGYTIGSITEYLTSFLVEAILHTKWWNYSYNILNVNGRICLLYSLFWGILTVVLIGKFNPIIDNFIDKIETIINYKLYKVIISIIIIFLMLNCIATCYAQDIFLTRIIVTNNIETNDFEERKKEYDKIIDNKNLNDFIDSFWNDTKMIKTFPNIKIEDNKGHIIYIDALLPNIQPYYLKIFSK